MTRGGRYNAGVQPETATASSPVSERKISEPQIFEPQMLDKRGERRFGWFAAFLLAYLLFATVLLILGLLSIWFSDPARLATAFGLISAGLAFALQQVVTSIAG